MQDSTKLKIMFWFTVCYMLIFTVVSTLNRNYEFLYYTLVMSVILFLLIKYKDKIYFSTGVAFGLTLVAALHIFGGNVHVNGIRLYDVWLTGWFKYDNLVHIIGSFTAALLAYNFILPRIREAERGNRLLMLIVVILMAMGVGAFNEILELGAVLWFNAAAQVGDYLNNAFDLFYNMIGAIIAVIYLFYVQKEQV